MRISLGRAAEQVDHLEVRVPSARLRRHTLIDTPGIASLSTDVSLRTMAFLDAEGERAAKTDAVIYLLRHMHASDVRFLESFHGDGLSSGTPVNAVGVLSRADEIGGARLDAMAAAARVAERYASDERLRRLCPVVVPVAGLLGAAGATLREDEYRTLAAAAAEPMAEVVELLLTADRFAASAPERREALQRLGLFGVRLSVRLIREGKVHDSADLAAALTEHSGIDRLREVFAAQFVGRSEVLKSRSALAVLDEFLAPGSALAAEAERIRASAHEFVELRLLHLVRSGRLPGTDEQLAEMDLLLGGAGGAAHHRLGLPSGRAADPDRGGGPGRAGPVAGRGRAPVHRPGAAHGGPRRGPQLRRPPRRGLLVFMIVACRGRAPAWRCRTRGRGGRPAGPAPLSVPARPAGSRRRTATGPATHD
nr:hypothetical protein GCM10020092_044990 [Actinoplanes digitatis]